MTETANASLASRSHDDKFCVFLSYSRKDIAFAEQLVSALEAFHYNVLIDRFGIYGAESWRARLEELILEADTVVFLLTPNSSESETCKWEVERASELHKRTVPVLISPLGSSKPPLLLQELNYIRFFPDPAVPGSGWGAGLAQLNIALSVDVNWIREHTRIAGLASRWEKGSRQPDLLVRGSELVSMRHWRSASPPNAPAITSLQSAFLDASETAEIDRQNTERERLQEMKAAQDARALALLEAEKALQLAADALRRRSRWRNLLFAAVAAGATITAILFLQATEKNREATAYLKRATAAEKIANYAESNAKKSELHAIVNEFSTSLYVIKNGYSTTYNINNYLETGVRLGFSLINNNRNDEAIQHLSKFRSDVAVLFPHSNKYGIDFYITLADIGVSIATLNKKETTANRSSITDKLFLSLNSLRYTDQSMEIRDELMEDIFRVYFYATNLLISSKRYDRAFQLALDIDERISSRPSIETDLPRLAIRSKGLLSWCAILANKPTEALQYATLAKSILERFDVLDMTSVELNYGHALLINGNDLKAEAEYDQFPPEDVKKDFESMLAAGFCFHVFAKYGVIDEKCGK
ncbi:toll/interleukin-1 receptor domain-containing protein [Mesorhizobium sp. GbtcB19]|uniref:toll/interleukin-1 receptor domain-containing protein n=1 Tax=Mesorhizobium sp. GbtcB19 TaxID=2824764 RepID=UPI001C2FA479|nr:toll/interleukin-1 receptor domain-containing protein [Mesorhizobium sp. GbtcB19]